MVKDEIHKKGFVYQLLRDGEEEYRFIYTKLKFNPLVWSRKRLDTYLEKLFSFVPEDTVMVDHEKLARFNEGYQVQHLSYPIRGRLPENKEGVFFILPSGQEFHMLKNEGKPLPKKPTLTLFHPLCPLPAVL